MSSFNLVEKHNYKKHTLDPVSLIEYIVFSNDLNSEKYALLKFRNNLNQILYCIKVNVLQYDEKGTLIEKSLLQYDSFSAKPQDEFVPNRKFALNYNCYKIEVNLEYAMFEQLTWENNEFSVVPYTREEFDKQFTFKNVSLESAEKAVKNSKKVEKSAPKGKRKTKVKNIIKMNFTKASKFVAGILTLALLVGVVLAMYKVRDEIDVFRDENFEYYKDVEGRVVIDRYIGEEKEIYIPRYIGGLKVSAIENNAFEGSDITKVTTNASNLVIGEEAFRDCSKLTSFIDEGSISVIKTSAFDGCTSLASVSIDGSTSVEKYAFRDCTSLVEYNGPNTSVYRQTFLNCSKLETFNYGTTSVDNFIDLFIDAKNPVEMNIKSVSTNQSNISLDFFKDCGFITSFTLLNGSAKVEYGSLKHLNISVGYECNEMFEILNGEIIATNVQASVFEINASMDRFAVSDFLDKINRNKIVELYIDSPYVKVNGDFIKSFSRLEKLVIGPTTSLSLDGESSLPSSLKVLSISKLDYEIVEIISKSNVKELIYTGSDSITTRTFQGLEKLQVLEITANCQEISKKAFEKLTNLVELRIPAYYGLTLKELGVRSELVVLEITNNPEVSNMPEGYFAGYNNLNKLTISANFNSLPSGLVSEMPSLTTFAITGDVSKLQKDLIGAGCYNLTDVTLPYIGTSSASACSYNLINGSYEYTRNLTITKETSLSENCLEGISSLERLVFKGEVIKAANESFASILSVDYFEYVSYTTVILSKLFSDDANINTFVVSTNTIQKNIFTNVNVNNVVIKEAYYLYDGAFGPLSYINVVYICDGLVSDSTDYAALSLKTSTLLFAGNNDLENAACQVYKYIKYDELENYIPNIK